MTGSVRLDPRKRPRVLATDLDGTLIPLSENKDNQADLAALKGLLRDHRRELVFVTGRHFESAAEAITQFALPTPNWLICDVGTSMFQSEGDGRFSAVDAYRETLAEIIASAPIEQVREWFQDRRGLRLQEEFKQGPFKLSFYTDASRLPELAAILRGELEDRNAPYTVIDSVDPFNGDGLIDLLPAGVSKAFALAWWVEQAEAAPEDIVFAGDSGNDLAALTAGYQSIVVGNADRAIAAAAAESHRREGWADRLFLANRPATSGVLQGCRWFELLPPEEQVDRPSKRAGNLGVTPISRFRSEARVWAPRSERVNVQWKHSPGDDTWKTASLQPEPTDGSIHQGNLDAGPGSIYCFQLDDQREYPDPRSRFQPNGVHGPSLIVNPNRFAWTDGAWSGVAKQDLVIYEMHVGSFTPEGDFDAAIKQLPHLQSLGATAVELLPVAQSPGRWNWGYDGVNLFAPRNTYGDPDALKRFVNACHDAGLAVLLDVVYNHLGPEGNYLASFGPYFSSRHHTPWGEAVNFDDQDCDAVRQFVVDNAIYWLDEYHLDGLRLDAVHFMRDDSTPHILFELREAVTKLQARVGRTLHLIAESNVYDAELTEPGDSELAYDAIWCDCLMHSLYSVALPELRLTPRAYEGEDDLATALRRGFVYSGREERRVAPAERTAAPLESLVIALQNHDVVGNHPHGKRLHQLAGNAFHQAAAALTLLYPSIPLLFMGEEFATNSPFPFFADFEDPRLREAVDRGRMSEYPQHEWSDSPRPSDPQAFHSAKLDWNHMQTETLAWYQQLIALRKQGVAEGWLKPSQLSVSGDVENGMFQLRYKHPAGGAVLVAVRLGSRSTSPAVAIEQPGDLLLSSRPPRRDEQGNVLLGENQAIVIRSTDDGDLEP